MRTKSNLGWLKSMLLTAGIAVAAVSNTGCQNSIGGQTLPSPYYIDDDVQYFPAGSEFKLQREAATMKQFNAQQQLAP